jgi:hypothetical protein
MIKKTIFVSILVISLVTISFGQSGQRWNVRNWIHTFDVTAPVQIKGKIVKVETVRSSNRGYGTGIHLTVADRGTQTVVNMGPGAFLSSNNWEFKEGERISVKAYKGTGNSSGQLFAAEISRAGKQLVLRDNAGLPMWRQSLNKNRSGSRWGGPRGFRGNRCWRVR